MNALLTVLAIVTAIVVLLLVIALFIKKEYSVTREIIIAQPKQKVFDFIKYLRNQDNFSKWATMDPDMIKEYRGTDGTPGFVSTWDSNMKNVGKGEQEIIKITDGEQVDFSIHFIKPFEGLAMAYMQTTAESENRTRVTWSFKSSLKYPMNLMLLFMNMEKMIGNDLQVGLNNLKSQLEKA